MPDIQVRNRSDAATVDWARRNLVLLAAAAIGLAIGLAALRVYDDRSAPEIVIRDATVVRSIVVQVGGAVATPGVYSLLSDARYADAIAAAGGAVANADLAAINLARRLVDEDVVEIPWKRSSVESTVGSSPVQGAAFQIDINTAPAEALEALPGIGSVLADEIVAYRTEHGPFASVDELARVPGISARMVDEMRYQIKV